MKHIYKYILLIVAICFITAPSYAFKKRKSKTHISASKKRLNQKKKKRMALQN